MKQQLLELIDAYGAARASNNAKLITMSATALQSFIDQVEVTPLQDEQGQGPEAAAQEEPVCPMPSETAPAQAPITPEVV